MQHESAKYAHDWRYIVGVQIAPWVVTAASVTFLVIWFVTVLRWQADSVAFAIGLLLALGATYGWLTRSLIRDIFHTLDGHVLPEDADTREP